MNESSLPPDLESRLLRAFDLPDVAQADALDALCLTHSDHAPELHRRMAELHRDAKGQGAGALQPGEQVGPYRLLSLLGEGGMGKVFLAEQRAPIQRRVALKVIKLGMDSKAVLARFEAERQALAMMEHSCIAKVLDAGVTDAGQPYFAMEHVQGIPITEYCDQNRLTFQERIELFQQVCSGVQHAHLKGVMHRDLKPGNVLVTVQDGAPTPKIIDFGLAKAMDRTLAEATIFTEHGVVMGTPEYMSPEQAGLGGLGIDTRTDVYSLGVMLYELLVGELPFARKELFAKGLAEMQRLIREVEPPRPSTKVTTIGATAEDVARRRRLDASALRRRLRGDLDWILMRALEKDRTRRYQSAHELADDLGRHLALEPVLAGPPGAGYRVRKLVRKHRAFVAAAAAVFGALVAGLWVSLHLYGLASDEAERAAAQEREATRQKGVAMARATEAEQARLDARQASKELERKQAELELKQGELERSLTRVTALRVLAESRLRAPTDPTVALLVAERVSPDASSLDANRALLATLAKLQERRRVSLGPSGPHFLAFPADQRLVYSWAPIPNAKLAAHSLPDLKVIRETDKLAAVSPQEVEEWNAMGRWGPFTMNPSDGMRALAPDALLVRTCDAWLVLDPSTLRPIRSFEVRREPGILSDGSSFWSLHNRRADGWSLPSVLRTGTLPTPDWTVPLDAPSRARLLLQTSLERILVLSQTQLESRAFSGEPGRPLPWETDEGGFVPSPDGLRALCSRGDRLALLSLDREPRALAELPLRARPFRYGWCDSRVAFVVDETRALHLLDSTTLATRSVDSEVVRALETKGTPGVASIRADGTCSVFDTGGGLLFTMRHVSKRSSTMWLTQHSNEVLIFERHGDVGVFSKTGLEAAWHESSTWPVPLRWMERDFAKGRDPRELWVPRVGARLLEARGTQRRGLWRAFSRDGSLVWARDGAFEVATGRRVGVTPTLKKGFGLGQTEVFGADHGSLLLRDGAVQAWPDVQVVELRSVWVAKSPVTKTSDRETDATGTLFNMLSSYREDGWVDWAADQQRIAVGTPEGGVEILNHDGSETLFACRRPSESAIGAGAFSPDGTRLVLLGDSGETWIRVVGEAWSEVLADVTRRSGPSAYAFQEDGSHISIGYLDGSVRVLKTADGTEVCALRPNLTPVTAIALSPDGGHLGTASLDGTARVFTIATGEQTHEYPHDGVPFLLGFGADGKTLVTHSPGHWHFWPMNLRELATEMKPRELTAEEIAEFGIPTGK